MSNTPTPQPDPEVLEAEFRSYLKEHGTHAAASNARKFWETFFFEAGKTGKPQTMDESGIPYLVLMRNAPNPIKQRKLFNKGFAQMPPEVKAERDAAAVERKSKQQELEQLEEERKERLVHAVSHEDKAIAQLVSPEDAARMTPEQKTALLEKASGLKKRIITAS